MDHSWRYIHCSSLCKDKNGWSNIQNGKWCMCSVRINSWCWCWWSWWNCWCFPPINLQLTIERHSILKYYWSHLLSTKTAEYCVNLVWREHVCNVNNLKHLNCLSLQGNCQSVASLCGFWSCYTDNTDFKLGTEIIPITYRMVIFTRGRVVDAIKANEHSPHSVHWQRHKIKVNFLESRCVAL